MMDNSVFIIGESATYLEALKAIDAGRRGFVIVLDDDDVVLGTLSDGDLRRKILAGNPLDAQLGATKAYNANFTSATVADQLDNLIEIFKNPKIEFLPILKDNGTLAGIVTRKQLYGLILQCKPLPAHEQLVNLDENLVDFEIFQRPWGIYKTTVLQDKYQGKVIQVRPGGQLSLQYHLHREEHWIVVSGQGIVQIGESVISAFPGSMFFIPKGTKHRMTNTSDTEQLIVTEVQIGDYFGEDDIVRIEDRYGRAKED